MVTTTTRTMSGWCEARYEQSGVVHEPCGWGNCTCLCHRRLLQNCLAEALEALDIVAVNNGASNRLQSMSRRVAKAIRGRVEEVVHLAPADDESVTPCCGRTPFELPLMDRLTNDNPLVTCRP